MTRAVLAVLAAACLGGCFAQFTGAAKVKNGPAGCRSACEGWGMELVGMVKMGEYSDGCICQVRGAAPGSAAAGAAAAVDVQMGAFHRWTQQTKGASPVGPFVKD
ncbi:MAG TPA: hypothetical protein VFK90_07630 [Anaeromyxobacter sp.]|nr:hypothetical protein [Anaeromyxobacter sp.]